MPVLDFFVGRVVINHRGCHIWTGACHERGYGRVRYEGKVVSCHRLAWRLATGEDLPPGELIYWECEDVRCVNFDHLFPGTPQERRPKRLVRARAFPDSPERTQKLLERTRRLAVLYRRRERELLAHLGKQIAEESVA